MPDQHIAINQHPAQLQPHPRSQVPQRVDRGGERVDSDGLLPAGLAVRCDGPAQTDIHLARNQGHRQAGGPGPGVLAWQEYHT